MGVYRGCHRAVLLALSTGLLAACGESETTDDAIRPPLGIDIARVASAQDALVGAHVATLDPATMDRAEIRLVLDGSAVCEFRYVSEGRPVLAFHAPMFEEEKDDAPIRGVLSLNGSLVALSGRQRGSGFVLDAGDIRTTLTAVKPQQDLGPGSSKKPANLLFEVADQLRVGYRGYFTCLPSRAKRGA